MMNRQSKRTHHQNGTQALRYKRNSTPLSRCGIGLLLLFAVALPVMAQGGLEEEPERMVSAVRLTYLGLASLVVWVIVFGFAFLTYFRQNRLEKHVAEIEAGLQKH